MPLFYCWYVLQRAVYNTAPSSWTCNPTISHIHKLEFIYNRLMLYVGWIILFSQKAGFAFDICALQMHRWSLCSYISPAHTNKFSILCLYISLSLRLLFVTSSLFLAHSPVIVQQRTSLCILSKIKPLHFLLCSQFILIDCSLTFLYVQWIIKRSAKLPSYSEVR